MKKYLKLCGEFAYCWNYAHWFAAILHFCYPGFVYCHVFNIAVYCCVVIKVFVNKTCGNALFAATLSVLWNYPSWAFNVSTLWRHYPLYPTSTTPHVWTCRLLHFEINMMSVVILKCLITHLNFSLSSLSIFKT
jgi:hypothetical protein